jgi:hypothetical protein
MKRGYVAADLVRDQTQRVIRRISFGDVSWTVLWRRRLVTERVLEKACKEFNEKRRCNGSDSWAGDCALLVESLVFH